MSGSLLQPWSCAGVALLSGLLLLLLAPPPAAGRLSNCSHPLVPEHLGFRCDPSPCQGFPHRSTIHFFCESGHRITSKKPSSHCRHGRWHPPIPNCIPIREAPDLDSDDSMSSMARTAVGVSIFLLTTTACLVVKSRLCPCHSHSSRRSSDQLDLMVDRLPVSLPSYEEAMYGSWGRRLPACSSPGPTQLLLAQEAAGGSAAPSPTEGVQRPLLAEQSPDHPPPPYEEVQPPRRDDKGLE